MSAIDRQNVSDFQCPKYRCFTFLSLFFLVVHHPCTPQALSFNYLDVSSSQNLNFTGDAFSSNGIISLTKNEADSNLTSSVGRVVYAQEFKLWEHATGKVADFATHYSFAISMLKPPTEGDGFTFFLTPNGAHIPDNSAGGCLGLIGNCEDFNPAGKSVVVIEIDTFKNDFDRSDNHIGIDINSIKSVINVTLDASLKNGTKGHIWFRYDHVKKELTAYLTFLDNPVYDGQVTLSYGIDLIEILPQWVTVGFSGSTGAAIKLHQIPSWEFYSTNFRLRQNLLLVQCDCTSRIIAGESGLLLLLLSLRLRVFLWLFTGYVQGKLYVTEMIVGFVAASGMPYLISFVHVNNR